METETTTTSAGQMLLRLGAWLLAAPYALTVAVVLSGAPSWSGVAYLAASGLLLGGLMTLPTKRRGARTVFGKAWPRGVSRAGLIALFSVMFVRCCSAEEGASLHMATPARLVDRLVDEQDIALSGTRVLVASGMLHDDREALPGAMREAYRQMAGEQGDLPSPVAATYLGLQRPSAYDMVLIEPSPAPMVAPATALPVAPATAIVFLHGYAGNFSLPCWQVSQAMKGLDVLTACPSTRWIGDWASPNGEATLRDVVKELKGRGITKIVLAGLSNGGFGASILAPRMAGTFAGVVLISGADDDAGPTGVPTLVIHGRADSMVGYGASLAYRARHPGAQLVTLEAGHFAMLVKSAETNQVLRGFVMQVTGVRERPGRVG